MRQNKIYHNMAIVLMFVCVIFCNNGQAIGETVEKKHNQFYKADQELNISEILDLNKGDAGTVSKVAVHYNMSRSSLEIDWLYNGRTIGHTALDKGLNKKVIFAYQRSFPAVIAVKFTGSNGNIQVTGVRAIVERTKTEASAKSTIKSVQTKTSQSKSIKKETVQKKSQDTVKQKTTAKAQTVTLAQSHIQFYETGQIINVEDIIEIPKENQDTVTKVTIQYNMTRSQLEIDWLYNGEKMGHTILDRGLNKKAVFDFKKPMPGSIGVRFTGPEGRVQVTSIKVDIDRDRAVAGSQYIKEDTGRPVAVDEDAIKPKEFTLATFVTDISITPEPVIAGMPAEVTATLSLPAPDKGFPLHITITHNNGEPATDFKQYTFDVTVSPGKKTVSVPIEAQTSGEWTEPMEVSLNVTSKSATKSQRMQVRRPIYVQMFTISPRIVRGGDTTEGKLVLSRPAWTGGIKVKLKTDGPAAKDVEMPTELSLAEGTVESTFDIKIGENAKGYFHVIAQALAVTALKETVIIESLWLTGMSLSPKPLIPGHTFLVTAVMNQEVSDTEVELVVAVREQNGALSSAFVEPLSTIKVPLNKKQVTTQIKAHTRDSRFEPREILVTVTNKAQARGQQLTERVLFVPEIAAFAMEGQYNIRPGSTAHASITLSAPAPAGGTRIKLAIDGSDAVQTPPEIFIPENANTESFAVQIGAMGEEQFVINAQTASGNKRSLQGKIMPHPLASLNFDPPNVRAGKCTVGTVTLAESAPVGGTLVTLVAQGPAAAAVKMPSEIRVDQGQKTGTFDVEVGSEAKEHFSVTASSSSMSSYTKAVLLEPPVWISDISIEPQPIIVGDTFQVKITMDAPIQEPDFKISVVIREPLTDPTYNVGPLVKGIKGPMYVTMPVGDTELSIPYSVNTTCAYEGDMYFYVKFINLKDHTVTRKVTLVQLPKIKSITVANQPIKPGTKAQGYVQLTKHAPQCGVVVRLDKYDSTDATWPDQITIPPAHIGGGFDIQVKSTAGKSILIVGEIHLPSMVWSSESVKIEVK